MRTLVVALGVAVAGSFVLSAGSQPAAALTKAECSINHAICSGQCDLMTNPSKKAQCVQRCGIKKRNCLAQSSN